MATATAAVLSVVMPRTWRLQSSLASSGSSGHRQSLWSSGSRVGGTAPRSTFGAPEEVATLLGAGGPATPGSVDGWSVTTSVPATTTATAPTATTGTAQRQAE
jgi:hypothetical protein